MTYQELYRRYFCSYGYTNYIPKYSSLLIESTPNRNEEEFMMAMAENADCDSYELEMTLKKVSSLTQIALRIYKAIVENSDIKDKSNFLVVQTALHESMFKTLNHLYRNCRKLLEAQSSRNKYDDLALYLKRLSKEYSLDKEQQSIVGLVWCKSLEAICNKLSEGDYHIRVYNWETHEVCFQIEDNNNDNMLKAQEQICASNGILFSKYYFFVFMFKTFQHLHLITQILESQKTGETKDDNPEIMELEPGAMDAFNKAAQEFLDKKN